MDGDDERGRPPRRPAPQLSKENRKSSSRMVIEDETDGAEELLMTEIEETMEDNTGDAAVYDWRSLRFRRDFQSEIGDDVSMTAKVGNPQFHAA